MTKKQRFKEFLQGLEIKINLKEYPDSIFFFKGDDYYFEYDWKNKRFWVSYDRVWKVFQEEYNMKYYEIQSLIKTQMEQDFKLEGITPSTVILHCDVRVEQGFKLEGITPKWNDVIIYYEVEEDFKLEGITPILCTGI